MYDVDRKLLLTFTRKGQIYDYNRYCCDCRLCHNRTSEEVLLRLQRLKRTAVATVTAAFLYNYLQWWKTNRINPMKKPEIIAAAELIKNDQSATDNEKKLAELIIALANMQLDSDKISRDLGRL